MWIIRQEPRWLTATCLPQEKRKKLIQKLERGGISTQMSIIRKGYFSLEIGSLILSSSPLSSSSPFPLLLCTPPLLSLLSAPPLFTPILLSSSSPLSHSSPFLSHPPLLSPPLSSSSPWWFCKPSCNNGYWRCVNKIGPSVWPHGGGRQSATKKKTKEMTDSLISTLPCGQVGH